MNHNQISDFVYVEYLGFLKQVSTVYFEQNPIAKLPDYKARVLKTFPNIQQIDSEMITVQFQIKFSKDAFMSNVKKDVPAPAKELLEKAIDKTEQQFIHHSSTCLLYTSPSPRDLSTSRMPSSA
eukprot:TRINITY_DN8120_c0_g3_i1.p1 TRINITY_DN8120_c0_g3~~TRINITY_DN8120_c0_g3_i1.p1  ORF type:complete len:124 (-),score=21.96 TRINITY_DN8120_c0_g3_i1:83-454(-)